ncbi:MAG: DHH family phosphoesterase [Desulfovibrionaceae bacterium]
MDTAESIAKKLALYDNYVITAHENPDGDALGSMLAMACILETLSKRYALYTSTGIPKYLSPLPFFSPVYTSLEELQKEFMPESLIILDVSESIRVGKELFPLIPALNTFNIDHHLVGKNFANIGNIVDATYAATGCIVAEIALFLGIPLTGILGEALYLSITEDTGNFVNTNTDARALSLAANIVDSGLRVADFIRKYKCQWTPGKMNLWGHILMHLETYKGNKVSIITITETLLKQYSCTPEDLEGIVSFIMHLQSLSISIVLKEHTGSVSGVKISIRSFDTNIIPLAQHFGGGGHRNACGAFYKNDLETTKKELLEALDTYIFTV